MNDYQVLVATCTNFGKGIDNFHIYGTQTIFVSD